MSSAVLEQQNVEPKKKTRFWNPGEYFDYSLLVIVLFLIGFGLVMVYSTSSYTASLRYQDAAYFLKRQGFFAVAGIIAMLFVSKIDYHFYKKVTGLAYLAALVLSIIVQFAGREAGGSSRWIQIGPIGFQPSEFAKVAIVLIMALATTNRVWKMNSFVTLLQIMFPSLLLTGIIAIENLSTAVICGVIIVAIVFVASPKYWHFLAVGGGAAVVLTLYILLWGYRGDRFDAWINYETHPKGYQTRQALYAIGSGGIWGKGLGQSIQKLDFIPEAHNDMIFSVICEELGIVGGIALILMFIVLVWKLFRIIMNARDLYGALLVVGILAYISAQVLINLAVVTNTMPNTGIPLPFISYGGSSMIFLLMEIGIALSVARQVKVRD